MRRLLLVARHEFVKYVTRRGFLLSIFMAPAWIVFASMVPRWIEHHAPPRAFMVVDRAGGYADALAAATARRTDRDALAALSTYAKVHARMNTVREKDPALFAMLTAADGNAQALARFRASGGGRAVVAQLKPFLRAPGPPFVPTPVRLRDLPPPPLLTGAPPRRFAARAAAILSAKNAPDAILVVPEDFGHGRAATAQFWSSGPPAGDLKDFLAGALTQALRRHALKRVAPDASLEALDVSAELVSRDPTRHGAVPSLIDQVQRYAPSGLAFLLALTIFMNAASLMSAVIEEKSSRIVEVMLSCVSPREFMIGKLIGAAGASLLTLLLWLGMGVLAAWAFVPGGLAVVAALVAHLAAGPLLPIMIVCFVCGLLIYASIFLAIGSMTASLQDAQALIGPTVILVMAPLILMPALLRDPNGTIATVLTWIPVYTPFFMMFRLAWHPPPVEVWLSVAMMIGTAWLLVWQMGRIFASHVLTSERPPQLVTAWRTLLGLKRVGHQTGKVAVAVSSPNQKGRP